MTTGYAERIDRAMHDAYGPFVPDSEARAIRHENARRGFKTCWNCLAAFRPTWVWGATARCTTWDAGAGTAPTAVHEPRAARMTAHKSLLT